VDAAQVDRSGRVQSSRVLRALRWRPADDLLIELVTDPAGDIAALLVTPAHLHSAPGSKSRSLQPRTPPLGSRCQVDTRGAITFPAAARALCDIDVGDTVVLVAEPASDRLFAYPALVAARLLLAHVLSSGSMTEDRTPHPDDTGHHRGGRDAT
jgi:bifunctional DNA-binding transcriptional regulator/antitoxin component of YhaV-PrlF toxin-antitoxin module